MWKSLVPLWIWESRNKWKITKYYSNCDFVLVVCKNQIIINWQRIWKWVIIFNHTHACVCISIDIIYNHVHIHILLAFSIRLQKCGTHTCNASSRVGERMSALGPDSTLWLLFSSFSNMGIRKQAVFPLPVRAIATTSLPSRMAGNVYTEREGETRGGFRITWKRWQRK